MTTEIEQAEAHFKELVRQWDEADGLCRELFREWEAAKRNRKAFAREKNLAWGYLQARNYYTLRTHSLGATMSSAGGAFYRGDSFRIVRGASGFSTSPGERPVFVFQVYLDDSGTTGLPIINMSGFFGAQKHWEMFEPQLHACLNEYEVPVFHAIEFNRGKPPFRGWKPNKKLQFAEDLFSIPHGHLTGVSVTLDRAEFEKAKAAAPKDFTHTSAIGYCFSAILTKVCTDPGTREAVKKDGISFLVESGPRNAGLQTFFHWCAKQPQFEGCLRSISFIPKDHCRAIQMADFFAFYSRRLMGRTHRNEHSARCPYIETIRRHGRIWQQTANTFTSMGSTDDVKNMEELYEMKNKR